MRFLLKSLLVFSLVFGLHGNVLAFDDVKGHLNEEAILWLRGQGVVEGYGDGTYRPNSEINRAEFLKIVMEYNVLSDEGAGNCFSDVGREWFAKYVCSALDAGVVGGYPDGYFRPERSINMVEAFKIVLEAGNEPVDYSLSGSWYLPYMDFAEKNDLFDLIYARKDDDFTRGEMAQLIWNLDKIEDDIVVWPPVDDFKTGAEVPLLEGDKYMFENGVVMKVNSIAPKSMNFYLYKDYDRGVYYPESFDLLSLKGDVWNAKFLVKDGMYGFLESIVLEDEGYVANLKFYDDLAELYERCLLEDQERCFESFTGYDVVKDGYKKDEEGMFRVVYPSDVEEMALTVFDTMQVCYDDYEDLFGSGPTINNLTLFFYYPEEGDIGSPHAKGDIIVFPVRDYVIRNFEDYREYWRAGECAGKGIPLMHELVHVFDYETQTYGYLREGFANYLSARFGSKSVTLQCEETGYRTYHDEEGTWDDFVEYAEDASDDVYRSGECFFQLLEQEFGQGRVDDFIGYLGETRSVEAESFNFFDDVASQFFGDRAREIAEQLNFNVTCEATVPSISLVCDYY